MATNSTPVHPDPKVQQRRWWILAILSISVFLVVVDNLIINVAIPTLARELEATTSGLQWIVDSYALVFAGLLLACGGLGDRFGRKVGLKELAVFFFVDCDIACEVAVLRCLALFTDARKCTRQRLVGIGEIKVCKVCRLARSKTRAGVPQAQRTVRLHNPDA